MNNVTQQLFLPNAGVNQPSPPSPSSQTTVDMPVPALEVNLQDVRDFSNVCRTCATITELVIPIFSGQGLHYNLAEKINQHMPIQVAETDILPLVVCLQCSSQLLAWHELVNCCEQADQALRSKIAADTGTDIPAKDPKTTKPIPNPTTHEEPQNQLPSRAPRDTTQLTPLRRCEFCGIRYPESYYKEHLITSHVKYLFFCEECHKYMHKKNFLSHMSHHAAEYTRKMQKDEEEKKNREAKIKEHNVNQNNNNTDEVTPQPETVEIPPVPLPPSPPAPAEERKSPKNIQNNEFSDHSDTEEGFGPLPESVFEAIEDSQDSQPTEDTARPETEVVNNETNLTSVPAENTSEKPNKKCRTCPACGKMYTASSSFFYHMKYTHKRVKDHVCTVCSRSFATRASLATHATTHTGESTFECNKCNKSFRSRASLYIHEQTHTGIKTWSCSQCDASFRWKTHLLRHTKRHSSEKTHVCATCGRGFSVRCDLLRHARTHDAGTYSCEKCNVKFAQLRYLKVHMDKKHSKKDTPAM